MARETPTADNEEDSAPSSVTQHSALHRLMQPNPSYEVVESALLEMDLLTFIDQDRVAAHIRTAEEVTAAADWEALAMHARLLRAELDRKQGDLVSAGSAARQVNSWAAATNEPLLLARSHNTLSLIFRGIGNTSQALEHAVNAVRLSPPQTPLWIQALSMTACATALALNGTPQSARRRLLQALELARMSGVVEVELMVLNNMAYAMLTTGYVDEAEIYAEQMKRLHEDSGAPLLAQYLDTLARIAIAHGRHQDAEALLMPVVDDPTGPLITDAESLAYCLLTLAVSRRLSGRADDAMAAAMECRQVSLNRGLAVFAADALEEIATQFAVAGNYRRAYQSLSLFNLESRAVQHTTREVRAEVVHAMYEVDEAQMARDRFRELARRDPLTGVHNRRVLDDDLPAQIALANAMGRPFAVALLDLDHFKRINDERSHQAGDAVLRTVAQILVEIAPAQSLVVRMGGEEFLVLLPSCDADEASSVAERMRCAIAEHPWGPITSGLDVTASIGLVSYRAGVSAAQVLAAADHHMYLAKRAGRNQVVGD